MYLLYNTFLILLGILLLPVFLYKALRYGKYLPGLSQRLGRLAQSLRFDGRATVWFHSCSVGETLSLQPIVDNLNKRFPDARFVFSTITETGRKVAVERFSSDGGENTFYFPVDLSPVVRRVLDWIRPAMVVIVDTEIWPNLLNEARHRGIPVALVNGRISAASFRRYRPAKPVLRRVFRNYSALMMQSADDARRIEAIGAPPEKITVTGNIKFDRNLSGREAGEGIARDLEACFGLADRKDMLILAGSTHPGEEQVLLEALQRVRRTPGLTGTRLVLAPRHPERFEEVAALAGRCGFKVHRRSTGPSPEAATADVLILDTLGELAAAYRFATVVFIGGTLHRIGGHSIMEPAFYAKAIVAGPSMENFRGILDEFISHKGIRQISAEEAERQIEQLSQTFTDLLQNVDARDALGRNAFSILERNRGAAGRTTERLATIFEEATQARQLRHSRNSTR